MEKDFDLEEYLYFDDCYFRSHIDMLKELETLTDQEPEQINRDKKKIKALVKSLNYALIEEA